MTSAITVLIPAYEPTDVLFQIVKSLFEQKITVVVVDDGSSSEFQILFHKLESYAHILRHSTNLGKGAALKTGLTYIERCLPSTELIVTADADGQHCISDILQIAHTGTLHSDSLILGSRHFDKKVPFRSRIGNSLTCFFFFLSTGTWIDDTQTGLRAFPVSFLPNLLTISGQRYEYEMNVLLYFAKNRIKIREMTIETIYINQNITSHFNIFRDSFLIYYKIIKFIGSSFVCFLIDYSFYSLFLFIFPLLGIVFSYATILANISARIISATLNYSMNRTFVFRAKAHPAKTAISYFVLAICILFGNSILLHFLANIHHMNPYLAKLLTEFLFFVLSFSVQHFFIFNHQKHKP